MFLEKECINEFHYHTEQLQQNVFLLINYTSDSRQSDHKCTFTAEAQIQRAARTSMLKGALVDQKMSQDRSKPEPKST